MGCSRGPTRVQVSDPAPVPAVRAVRASDRARALAQAIGPGRVRAVQANDPVPVLAVTVPAVRDRAQVPAVSVTDRVRAPTRYESLLMPPRSMWSVLRLAGPRDRSGPCSSNACPPQRMRHPAQPSGSRQPPTPGSSQRCAGIGEATASPRPHRRAPSRSKNEAAPDSHPGRRCTITLARDQQPLEPHAASSAVRS